MTDGYYNDRGRPLPSNSHAQQIYTKLQDDEVRTLLLAPGKKHRPLVCELEVVKNTRTHQYEALSYVWGDARKHNTIECNGLALPVTKSLHDALLHLRYPLSWRRLWVDQLCIDQGQSHELRSQVRHMGNIYSNACRVVVWLGNRDSNLAGAWQLVQETSLGNSLVRSDFLDQSPSSTPTKRPSLLRSMSTSSKGSLSSSITSSTDSLRSSGSWKTPTKHGIRKSSSNLSPNLKKALSIFQHEWFKRKWTFQEIVMSKAAIVCCGDVEMAWSDLTSWYFHYAAKRRSSTLLYDSLGSFENIMNVRSQLDKQDEAPSRVMKLSELLMLTRQRDSLKAEDTIYALLGLHAGFSQYVSEIEEEDGWLPVPELFLAAFKYCLKVEGDLSMLSASGLYAGNKSYPYWPTWLPDWREHLPIRPLVLHATEVFGSEYHAAGDSIPATSILEHDDRHFTLLARGTRIGIAVTKTGSWPNGYFVADKAAQSVFDRRIPSTHAQSISGFSQLVEQCKSDKTGYANHVVTSAIERQEICETLRTSAAVCTGDWVCMLLGGPVLYILRPITDTQASTISDRHRGAESNSLEASPIQCRYVGECAVVGIMDGSLMIEYDENESQQFEIV